MTLPLLPDGSCPQAEACRQDANAVSAECPQLWKCGSCLGWSPRGPSPTRRNEGVCHLDRDARRYLDCNAAACPYYRPRLESPAHALFRAHRPRPEPRSRGRTLGREAPAPTPAALAMAASAGLAPTEHGALFTELALELSTRRTGTLPALLERFRGGTAILAFPGGKKATVPVERWYLWICAVKTALDGLEQSVASSGLPAEDRDKITKDIKGMRGSLTTFNLLFRDKEDHFVGMKSEP